METYQLRLVPVDTCSVVRSPNSASLLHGIREGRQGRKLLHLCLGDERRQFHSTAVLVSGVYAAHQWPQSGSQYIYCTSQYI